jgi:hypothetical protein
VPTRYWLAAVIFAAGQIFAFSPYLPLVRQPVVLEPELVGLLTAIIALVLAWLASRRTTVAANPYDQIWIDFRDTFGLFWGLRVQERMNAAAKQFGWDLELGWSGFKSSSSGCPFDAIDPAIEPTLRTTFKGLLRRFVTNLWIDKRL